MPGVGSAAEMLAHDFVGCLVGANVAVVFVLAVRNTRAAWTWVLVAPVAAFIVIPSMEVSPVASVAGMIASTGGLLLVLKNSGETSDFGLRDALGKWWVRIGLTILALYVIEHSGSGLLFLGILTGLGAMWRHYGFPEFREFQERYAEADQ